MAPPDVITTTPPIGRRREARLRVALNGRVISLDGSVATVLADISEHGARMAIGGERLRPGAEAVLQWDGGEAFGVVVWCAREQCGLRFYDPLPPETITALRRVDDARRAGRSGDEVRAAARAFVQGRAPL